MTLQILLAEDSQVNQQLTAQILRRNGFSVTIAEDGGRAVACAKEKQFDLVLMDIEMPVLNGIEATGKIRVIDGYQEVPIVALTGNGEEADQQRYIQAGMDDYLVKPVNVTMLTTLISRLFPLVERVVEQEKTEKDIHVDTEEIQLFDRRALLEKVGGKMNFALHIIQLFFKGLQEISPSLQAAIDQMDREAIRRNAHRIKGSMANASLIAGLDAIATMEKNAATLNQEEIQTLYDQWAQGTDAIYEKFIEIATAFMAEKEAQKKPNP